MQHDIYNIAYILADCPSSCCPSDNYCTWSNSQVACCANDCTCSGWSSGGGSYEPSSWYSQSTWQQSTWQPETTTVYYQPTTSYYQPPTTTTVGVVAPVGYTQANGGYTTTATQQTVQPVEGGNYCSTLYAHGPGLPTTASGQCGTILVEEASSKGEAMKTAIGVVRMLAIVGVLQVMGGVFFVWR